MLFENVERVVVIRSFDDKETVMSVDILRDLADIYFLPDEIETLSKIGHVTIDDVFTGNEITYNLVYKK